MAPSQPCLARRLHGFVWVSSLFPLGTTAFLLGIDFGSQYFKAAVVAPGRAFEVVHNQHSKRKTPTAVSFHEKLRTFGDDAVASASRDAAKTPMLFSHQLGRNFTATAEEALHWLPERLYPYALGTASSGGLRFDFGGDAYTIEEVSGHVLNFAKELARQAVGGAAVTETVLTVPSGATALRRRALLAAARIAGLPRPSLIHEITAAALQRAPDLELSGNGTQNHSMVLYYNMGASHTEACLVAYRGAMHMGKGTAAMEVLGCGGTEELGAHQVDLLIMEQMLLAFQAKHPKLAGGIAASVRALRKLEKEAAGLKHVLSANREGQFRVESLYEDTDFAQPVKREALEEWCAELFSKFSRPIEVALSIANVTLRDVDAVEMVGGGWRIPRIQSLLSEYLHSRRGDLPALPLSQHVNGDEAMATGAAFFGANSSISFRTKKIFLADTLAHQYTLLLRPLNLSQPHELGWNRSVMLFPSHSKMRSRKTVKLNIDFDLRASLLENDQCVLHWNVSGIHASSKVTYAALGTPLLSLKLEIDPSGVVQMSSATAIFDEPVVESTLASVAGNASGADASMLDGNFSREQEDLEGAEATEASDTPLAGGGDANATDTKRSKPKIKKRKVALEVLESFEDVSPRPLLAEEMEQAIARLTNINAADAEMRRIEAARNALESYIYQSREKLGDDEACHQVSTEDERDSIVELLTQHEEWLYEDEATAANASTFEVKLAALSQRVSPITSRAHELEQRPLLPEKIDKVRRAVNSTLDYVRRNMTWVDTRELEGVANLTAAFEEWWANATLDHAQRALTEEPAYYVLQVEEKLAQLESEALRLTKIKKIDPIPYNDYGRYGDYYGGYGGYGYDDPRMRGFYESMYRNFSGNGTNYSDLWRNFSNFTNFRGWNNTDYMRSYYEHAARNFSGNSTEPGAGGGGAGAGGAEL